MDRQRKKSEFEGRAPQRHLIPILLVVLILIATGAGAWFLLDGPSGPVPVSAENGQVSLPLSKVSDGKAHFFSFRNGGTDIRFFILKSHDGVIRAAFDTCDVCYREKKGYRQAGDFMVCNNCDQQFRSDKINEIKGGCNPTPLNRVVSGDRLLIAEAELVKGAWYFQ